DELDAALAQLLADPPSLDERLARLLESGDFEQGETPMEASAEVVAFRTPRSVRARRALVAGGAVVAALATTGGLAAASVLPPPVQRVVADAASHVGIELPKPTTVPRAVHAAVTVPSTSS